jgi:hypothetical protein
VRALSVDCRFKQQPSEWLKYWMRFYEFKPVKPLTPQQQRVRSIQQQIEFGRKALAAERDRQRRAKELERQRKAAAKLSA